MGAIVGFWGMKWKILKQLWGVRGQREGKSSGAMLLCVKGWVSQEAGPELQTTTQDICLQGLGSTSVERKEDGA